MKNKKAEQEAARRKHKELIKAQRRKEPGLQRKEPTKSKKPTILIVCEGKNTEPSYFKNFKLTSATIKAVGEGYNTVSLVERAKEIAERGGEKKFDQIWCVFDADPKFNNPKQAENFNQAIQLAEKYGFGAAYSNQAFEYWIILHFDDHQGGPMNRTDYSAKINSFLKLYGLNFDKSRKLVTEEIFDLLSGKDDRVGQFRVDLAIERAKKIFNKFDHTNPAKEESSTTVFRLVEEILMYV